MELITIWDWVAGLISNLVEFFKWFGNLTINVGGAEFGVAGLLSVGLLGFLAALWMIRLIAG